MISMVAHEQLTHLRLIVTTINVNIEILFEFENITEC